MHCCHSTVWGNETIEVGVWTSNYAALRRILIFPYFTEFPRGLLAKKKGIRAGVLCPYSCMVEQERVGNWVDGGGV